MFDSRARSFSSSFYACFGLSINSRIHFNVYSRFYPIATSLKREKIPLFTLNKSVDLDYFGFILLVSIYLICLLVLLSFFFNYFLHRQINIYINVNPSMKLFMRNIYPTDKNYHINTTSGSNVSNIYSFIENLCL